MDSPANDGASVWRLSLADFRDATAADRPTPGCGAAAAVVSDIGLALVLKGLRISEARGSESARRRLLKTAEGLIGRPGAFADADIRAFQNYLHASRDDTADLQTASRQACAVPLATAHSCLEALELANDAWPQVAVVVRSDVQAGALLIHAGLSAALINVDADMASLDDAAAREQAGRSRERLQSDADKVLRQLLDQAEADNPPDHA